MYVLCILNPHDLMLEENDVRKLKDRNVHYILQRNSIPKPLLGKSPFQTYETIYKVFYLFIVYI